eukprot:TRINITY_DN20671_c0_g1_i1.p2 TRINITY_DN20671_c0_g1~~TRINITY_DN20671_c0_g1_i1.p2  ORF type:complete len:115 (+),score=28.94 TRINITY_DN20671_c0_g1_i1:88-432(+)
MNWKDDFRQLRLRQHKVMCEKMVEVWSTELAESGAGPAWTPYPDLLDLEDKVFSSLKNVKFRKTIRNIDVSNQDGAEGDIAEAHRTPAPVDNEYSDDDDDFACLLPIEEREDEE